MFGNYLTVSSRMVLGMSVCRATAWISDTSVTLSIDRNVLSTIQSVLTAGLTPGSISESISFQPIGVDGTISNGPNNIAPLIFGFLAQADNLQGSFFYTVSSRVGITACESSPWSSSSSLLCKTSYGLLKRYASLCTLSGISLDNNCQSLTELFPSIKRIFITHDSLDFSIDFDWAL